MIDFNASLDNILPLDGEAYYYGQVLSPNNCLIYFERLLNDIEWRHDEAIIFGKKIITKRKVAWYADEAFEYTYSKITKRALLWFDDLFLLKQIVEKISGETFNSCLCNLYHSGAEGMGWHSDGERDLKKHGAIASLSLGAERKFVFKHKNTKEKVPLFLQDGSLLVMKSTTQSHWQHSVPTSKKQLSPRINLTFRTIVKN